MHATKEISKLMNTRAQDMSTEQLKEAFVLYHTEVMNLTADLNDYRTERNAVAIELRKQDIKVVSGFRIEARTEWALPSGYTDDETPGIEDLDEQIAALETQLKELKKKRKTAADIQMKRCREAGTAKAVKISIDVREVA